MTSREPFQETGFSNKENKSSAVYDNVHSNTGSIFSCDDLSSLEAEKDKVTGLKRLNFALVERLKQAETEIQGFESRQLEFEKKLKEIQAVDDEKYQELYAQWKEADEERKRFKEQAEQLQFQLDITKEELEKAKEDFDKISTLFEEQLEENSTLHDEKSDILKQVRTLKETKRQLEMSVEQLSEQLQSFSVENEKLKQKIQQYQTAFDVRDEALQQISAELREKRQKVHHFQVECVEKGETIAHLENKIKSLDEKNNRLEQVFREKQQFMYELHSFTQELESSGDKYLCYTKESSTDKNVESLSVDSFSTVKEISEWVELEKLRKWITVRDDALENMKDTIFRLEKEVKDLQNLTKSKQYQNGKIFLMSRLASVIKHFFAFWMIPKTSHFRVPQLDSKDQQETVATSCSHIHKLFGDSSLQRVLQDFPVVLEKLGESCQDLEEFLLNIRQLLYQASVLSPLKNSWDSLPPREYYQRFLEELQRVGWEHVASISSDLKEITFELVDRRERKHYLLCRLSDDYPYQAPMCSIEAPSNFSFPWYKGSLPENDNMSHLYFQCMQFISQQEDIFDVQDDWDKNTCIIEPKEDFRRSLYRRIMIDHQCSLWVEISPHSPRGIPTLRFLGPEKNTRTFTNLLSERMAQWNTQLFPRENFEKLMNISFPSQSRQKDLAISKLECGICYSDWIDGIGAPDITCEMASCGRYYHTNCLYEWLRSLPDVHESFDVYFGECPYCMQPIRVRKPDH